MKQQDQSLWSRIKKWFNDFAAKLRNAYKSLDPYTEEGKAGKAAFKQADNLAKLWAEGLKEATQNYNGQNVQKNNAPEGVRYSLRGKTQQELTAAYQSEVDSILNMQDTTAKQLVVGYTPSLYEKLGMPSLPLTIGSGHVYSAAKTEAEAKQDGNYKKGVHYHGLGDTATRISTVPFKTRLW